MDKFNYFMPTRMVYGENVVKDAGKDLALGKKALIVTGRGSAKLSGALDDVLKALTTPYALFDQVENNPTVETVIRGGQMAKEEGCDYIIAIGGGSPLDAAKVMGILAVNDRHPLQLYKEGWETPALPLIAIPTTSGTGSEVTQYAVLTIEEEETKKGLGGPDLFPKVAYLDPKYTKSLPSAVTIDTAVDALSHLVEGYLSNRSTTASDLVALQGIALWGSTIDALRSGQFNRETRSALLLASSLGGITIAQTGTTLVHALGYPLTYFHEYPHGRANGVLMGAYLAYSEQFAKERVETVLQLLELDSVAEFGQLMDELFKDYVTKLTLNEEQIRHYASRATLTRNIANSIGNPSEEQLAEILRMSVGG